MIQARKVYLLYPWARHLTGCLYLCEVRQLVNTAIVTTTDFSDNYKTIVTTSVHSLIS